MLFNQGEPPQSDYQDDRTITIVVTEFINIIVMIGRRQPLFEKGCTGVVQMDGKNKKHLPDYR